MTGEQIGWWVGRRKGGRKQGESTRAFRKGNEEIKGEGTMQCPANPCPSLVSLELSSVSGVPSANTEKDGIEWSNYRRHNDFIDLAVANFPDLSHPLF